MSSTKDYRKIFRAERTEWALSILGSKCKNCNSIDNLEFHHSIPSEKLFNVLGALERTKESIYLEIMKCDLLCSNCHMDETLKARGVFRAVHGTSSMYSNQKCRCKDCTRAWREYVVPRINTWRLKKRLAKC